MALYLNRERMRLVKHNEKGKVVKRKRYAFGDKVDEDFLDEDRREALIEKGTLVESEDDLDKRAGWKHAAGISPSQARGQATTVAGGVGAAGAASSAGVTEGDESVVDDYPSYTDLPRPDGWGEFSDEEKRDYIYAGVSNTLVPEPNHLDENQGGGVPTTTSDDNLKTAEGDDVEIVDAYSDMDYSQMQDAAKAKGLRYTGISTDDLRTSLRANNDES